MPALRHEPVGASGLVDRVADLAASLSTSVDDHGVRVGVDSAVGVDGDVVASALVESLRERAVPVVRVRQEGFLRPRSVRLELGADDPGALWERWYDDAGLRREVLDPLGPGGAMTWLPSLWDVERDRASRAARRPAPPGTVVVVDGRFLLRWEVADAFDLVVHLQTSAAAQARRCDDAAERARLLPAWQRYLDETDPVGRLLVGDARGLVVRHDDPMHPALVWRVT